jgi:hypothetical protein
VESRYLALLPRLEPRKDRLSRLAVVDCKAAARPQGPRNAREESLVARIVEVPEAVAEAEGGVEFGIEVESAHVCLPPFDGELTLGAGGARRFEKLLRDVDSGRGTAAGGQRESQPPGPAGHVENPRPGRETEVLPEKRGVGGRGFLGDDRPPELDGEAREEIFVPGGRRLQERPSFMRE